MKTTHLTRIACAGTLAILLFCQCSVEELSEPVIRPSDPAPIEICASLPDETDPLTRVFVTDDQKGGAKVEWDAEDLLMVEVYDNNRFIGRYTYSTDAEKCKTGRFTYDKSKNYTEFRTLDPTKAYNWRIRYCIQRWRAQEFSQPTAHLQQNVYLYSEALNVPGNESVTAEMDYQTTLMKFRIQNNEDKPIVLKSLMIGTQSGAPLFKLIDMSYHGKWETSTRDTDSEFCINVLNAEPIAPGATYDLYYSTPEFGLKAGEKLNFKVLSDAGMLDYTKTIPDSLTFKAGTMNTTVIPVRGSSIGSMNIDFLDKDLKHMLVHGYTTEKWNDVYKVWEPFNVLSVDKNQDGEISREEAKSVTYLDGIEKISSFEGIQYMPNLEHLKISGPVSALDLSGNPELKELMCISSDLSVIDLSHNPKLIVLNLVNNHLDKVDVSHLADLRYLSLGGNKLTELDIRNCPNLENLYVDRNRLTQLDLSANNNIKFLTVRDNQLQKLSVSNLASLTELTCSNTGISTLDVRNNTNLEYLDCSSNQLSALDLTGNPVLKYLRGKGNQITSIAFPSRMSMLEVIYMDDNPLQQLNVNGFTSLRQINVCKTALSTLDVSTNYSLEFLNSRDTPSLSTIYVWKNFNSESVHCNRDKNTQLIEKESNIDWGAAVSFEDPAFENYLRTKYDKNGDMKINVLEIGSTKNLTVYDHDRYQIKSMKGIEQFPKLESIKVSYSMISSIDLSGIRNLMFADLSEGNTLLTTVYVKKGFDLKRIRVADGVQIIEKDVQ